MKIGQVIDKYIVLREKKEAIQRRHKDELAKLNEQMSTVEKWLHRELHRDGLSKQSSEQGNTVFLQTADSCSVQDKEAFLNYVKENDRFELMDVRANKSTVRDFMGNFDEIPPGIKFTSTEVVRVRRKS